MSGFENQQGLYLGEPKGCGRLRFSSWKAHTQPHLLWVSGKAAAWAIGSSLTSFKMCARRAGFWWNFLEDRNTGRRQVSSSYYEVQCRRVPFSSLSINLANITHPVLVFPWGSASCHLQGLAATSKGVPVPSHMVNIPEPLQCGSWSGGGGPVLPSVDGGLGQHKCPSKAALTLGASHTHQCTQNSCS